MATFEVRKERVIIDCDTKSLFDSALEKRKQYEVRQQAIFKDGNGY
jgi:hypothetical protein